MQQIVIYRLPLFESYRYSLIYDGYLRPDEVDEEAIIHQVLIYDEAKRLVKNEKYKNGELEKIQELKWDKNIIVYNKEYFAETGGENEIYTTLNDNKMIKKYFNSGELISVEEYILNEQGKIISCSLQDPEGNELQSWEANANGDLTKRKDKEGEIIFSYNYDSAGKPIEIIRLTPFGEEISKLSYLGDKISKEEIWLNGVCQRVEEYEYNKNGEEQAWRSYIDGFLQAERLSIRDEQNGLWLVKLQKYRLVKSGNFSIQDGFHSGRLEFLFNTDGMLTDALTCADCYRDEKTGLELDSDAYYFFEVE